ncbi:MAG: hypothetical protein AAGK14_01685 [Verrucomicrobiota bacterium]
MTWWRHLRPRARGWELGWLVALQAVAVVYPGLLVIYDLNMFRELWFSVIITEPTGLFPPFYYTYQSSNNPWIYLKDIFYFNQPTLGNYLLAGAFWVFFWFLTALLSLPLVWAWLDRGWRSIGWVLLGLAGFYILCFSFYLWESFPARYEFIWQDPATYWFPYTQFPLVNLVCLGYCLGAVCYGHLGRILFAPSKKPPAEVSAAEGR